MVDAMHGYVVTPSSLGRLACGSSAMTGVEVVDVGGGGAPSSSLRLTPPGGVDALAAGGGTGAGAGLGAEATGAGTEDGTVAGAGVVADVAAGG